MKIYLKTQIIHERETETVIIENYNVEEDFSTNVELSKECYHRQTRVEFVNAKMKRFPKGLGKVFPNLWMLIANSSGMTEFTKDDLKDMPNLAMLFMSMNQITALPSDLFEGTPNIEAFSIQGNKISTIEIGIFDGLKSLSLVSLLDNTGFNDYFGIRQFANVYKSTTAKASVPLEKITEQFTAKPVVEPSNASAFCLPPCNPFDRSFEVLSDSENEAVWEEVVVMTAEESVVAMSAEENEEEAMSAEENGEEVVAEVEWCDEESLEADFTFDMRAALMEPKLMKEDELIVATDRDLQLSGHILNLESLKDFTVTVSGTDVKVHRFMLAAHSPLMSNLFETDANVRMLELADVTAKGFKAITNFIYKGQNPDDQENMLEVLAAAHKLGVEPMKTFADEKLLLQINEKNAFDILKAGNKYESTKLIKASFEVLKTLMPTKVFKDKWQNEPAKIEKLFDAKRQMEEKILAAQNEFKSFDVSDDEDDF